MLLPKLKSNNWLADGTCCSAVDELKGYLKGIIMFDDLVLVLGVWGDFPCFLNSFRRVCVHIYVYSHDH